MCPPIRIVAAFYAGPVGQVYAQLLAVTVTDPEAAELLRQRFLEGRRELIRQMWRRGVQRGESALRTDIDVEVAQDVLFGSIIFRLVSGHAPSHPPRRRPSRRPPSPVSSPNRPAILAGSVA